jgi:hypothetical protein
MSLRPLRVLPLLALLLGCTPQIGKKCTLSTDCSQLGDRLCDTTQPGGYCTVFNCEPDQCPNAICVAFNPMLDPACGAATDGRWPRFERSFCLASCNGDGDCRDQYQCIDLSSTANQTARRAYVVDLGAADGGLGYKVCMPATCNDGVKDGAETDLDCGGPVCAQCSDGKRCNSGGDCLSGNCPGGVCVEAHCMDRVKNGSETDVDCGGPDCAQCSGGQGCATGSDCTNGACDTSQSPPVCLPGNCSDQQQNGLETDVDCGGPVCGQCANGKQCAQDSDCTNGYCSSSSTPPRCGTPPLCSAVDAGFDGSIPWTPYTPPDGG